MTELNEIQSDPNEIEEQELPPITAFEVLQAENIQGAVNKAKQFCQNLEIDYDKWHGVNYDHSREVQVRKSGRKLAGFYPAIAAIDRERWENFYKYIINIPENNQYEFSDILYRVFEDSSVEEAMRWQADAATEINPFLRYIDQLQQIQNMGWTSTVSDQLTSERISIIVAEFLTKYVGGGDHRVYEEEGNRTGFDGENKTCPVARSIGKGMVYFAYLCAEYVLMQAIGEKFQILREAKNTKL